MKISALPAMLIICSCATIKKNKSTSLEVNQRVDSSRIEGQFVREITTIKTAIEPYKIDSDTVSLIGFVNIEDSTVFHQVSSSSNIVLTTTLKPIYKNGVTLGYNVSSKAITIPKIKELPVKTVTTTKESGIVNEATTTYTKQLSNTESSTKSSSGLRKGLWTVIFCLMISLILFVTYKFH